MFQTPWILFLCKRQKIIVADDCSLDKTVSIVKEYQDKHPGKIVLLESEKNQKLMV